MHWVFGVGLILGTLPLFLLECAREQKKVWATAVLCLQLSGVAILLTYMFLTLSGPTTNW